MASSTRERRTIHPSLIRPVLFGGAERGVAVVTFMAAVGIPLYAGLHLVTVGIALLFAFPIHALGVWAAKQDPQMIAVYLRSLTGRDHYLPWGSRQVRTAPVHPSIPRA
jgi:type IV secretory pathway TrbD component